jgi:hypothetical protein
MKQVDAAFYHAEYKQNKASAQPPQSNPTRSKASNLSSKSLTTETEAHCVSPCLRAAVVPISAAILAETS